MIRPRPAADLRIYENLTRDGLWPGTLAPPSPPRNPTHTTLRIFNIFNIFNTFAPVLATKESLAPYAREAGLG